MNEDDQLWILAKLYKYAIEQNPQLDHTEHRFGDKTSLNHLGWMLDEIISNQSQTETKKHRWLGFVQGILIAYGITNVNSERNRTRPILNGA